MLPSTKRGGALARTVRLAQKPINPKKPETIGGPEHISVEIPDVSFAEKQTLKERTEKAIAGLEQASPAILRISTVSAHSLLKKAVVEITDPDENPSKNNGVNSHLMGTPSINNKCGTCNQLKYLVIILNGVILWI